MTRAHADRVLTADQRGERCPPEGVVLPLHLSLAGCRIVAVGTGSLLFQAILLPAGFPVALGTFAALALITAAAALPLFHTERPADARTA